MLRSIRSNKLKTVILQPFEVQNLKQEANTWEDLRKGLSLIIHSSSKIQINWSNAEEILENNFEK